MQILSPFPGLLVKFKIEGDLGDFPSEPATERMLILPLQINGKHYHGISPGEPSNTYKSLY